MDQNRLNWRLSAAVIWAIVSVAMPATGAEPKAKSPAKPKPQSAQTFSPGEDARVSMFGIEAKGTKFVYVLDRSGSMGGGGGDALAAAKKELLASIDKLDTVQQFQIIFYNENARQFNPAGQSGRLAFGTDQNKAEARRFIGTIESDGGTAHEDALMMAIRLHPDVIFLLTDADDPKLTSRDLERLERRGAGTIINTIEFGTGPQPEANNFLVKLATQSGGEHTYVDVSKLDRKE